MISYRTVEHAGRMDCARNGCPEPCKWDGVVVPILSLPLVGAKMRRNWTRRKWYRLWDGHAARHVTRTVTTTEWGDR